MSIKEQLKALEKDPKFQKKLQAAVKEKRKKMGAGGSGGSSADRQMADEQINVIKGRIAAAVFRRLPCVAMHAGNSAEGLFEVTFVGTDANGDYIYNISFRPQAVHRPSLWPEGYPEGLSNIVTLYSHGSNESKGPIWNRAYDYVHRDKDERTRKGEHLKMPVYREGRHIYLPAGHVIRPDPFLINAIDAINAEMAKDHIRVSLNSKYRP